MPPTLFSTVWRRYHYGGSHLLPLPTLPLHPVSAWRSPFQRRASCAISSACFGTRPVTEREMEVLIKECGIIFLIERARHDNEEKWPVCGGCLQNKTCIIILIIQTYIIVQTCIIIQTYISPFIYKFIFHSLYVLVPI